MKKTIMTLLLSLAAILNTNAYDAKVNDIYYNLDHTNYTAEVTYYDESNNSNAYTGDIKIPSAIPYNNRTYTVTSIGERAFRTCNGLTSVIIPNSVKSIGNYAFTWCQSLKSVTVGNSVTTIGNMVFYGCYYLTSITLGNSVKTIGSGAFQECENLTSITIPNSVTNIGGNAFSLCSSLTFITLGESLTHIDYGSFSSCHSLVSITIPNSVTEIKAWAFDDCTSLVSVTLGASVRRIGNGAFSRCTRLSEIYSHNTVPPSCETTSLGDVNLEYCRLHVPAGANDAYVSSAIWGDFYNINNDIIDQDQLKTEVATLTQANETLTQEVANLNKENHRLTLLNATQGRLLSIKETENEALRLRLETGDMDGNGVTTAADVAKVVQAALTQTEPQVTEE